MTFLKMFNNVLVFILALGACRAACRMLPCPGAANRQRGLHRAVSTTDGTDSDDSDAAPQRQRRRKRRSEKKQRAKVVSRNGSRGPEADEKGVESLSTEQGDKPTLARILGRFEIHEGKSISRGTASMTSYCGLFLFVHF